MLSDLGDKSSTYKQVREVLDAIHKDIPGTDQMLLATEKIKTDEPTAAGEQ